MLFAMLRAEKELLVSCLSLAFFASVAWNAAEGQKTEATVRKSIQRTILGAVCDNRECVLVTTVSLSG